MDEATRKLCHAAAAGDAVAAERLIGLAARAGHWWVHEGPLRHSENMLRAGLVRFLGYLRWRGYDALVQAVSPPPPATPFSSLGRSVVESIPVQVLGAAAGGLAERVAQLVNADVERVYDVARASNSGDEDQWRVAFAALRTELGPFGPPFDPLIPNLLEMADRAAVSYLTSWAMGMNPRSHPANRAGDFHYAVFYGDMALAAECEAKKAGWEWATPTPNARLPYPPDVTRGWWPSRSCMTKARRASRRAMLTPAVFATASYVAC